MADTRIPLCKGEELNMGSFVLNGKDGKVYELVGLSADVDKLPTVQAIGTGSTALCADTGTVLMYEATTKTWYELQR